jgi:hypothetical protein
MKFDTKGCMIYFSFHIHMNVIGHILSQNSLCVLAQHISKEHECVVGQIIPLQSCFIHSTEEV